LCAAADYSVAELGPEAVAGVEILDLLTNIGGADPGERAHKPLVVIHQRQIESNQNGGTSPRWR
jgi:hypothetical protein